MKMSDTREIKAPPEVVYRAILDPEVLKACVPGATEVTGSPEEGYEAVVTQKVGPVKATFRGRVTISDMEENRALTLTGEGKGGAAGFARGSARVLLEPMEDGGTRLSYEVEANVGGKLAQLGSRIIDGFARKMADAFFARLQAAVEAPAKEDEAGEASDDGAAEAPAEGRETRPRGWFRRMLGG